MSIALVAVVTPHNKPKTRFKQFLASLGLVDDLQEVYDRFDHHELYEINIKDYGKCEVWTPGMDKPIKNAKLNSLVILGAEWKSEETPTTIPFGTIQSEYLRFSKRILGPYDLYGFSLVRGCDLRVDLAEFRCIQP